MNARALTAVLLTLLAGLGASAQAEPIFAVASLGPPHRLVKFDSASPEILTSSVAITGLQQGEAIHGLAFRPATGALYALVFNAPGMPPVSGRLYTIDTASARATLVSPNFIDTILLQGFDYGFDFDPVSDLIRIVSTNDVNLRVNPNTGLLVQVDMGLNDPGPAQETIGAIAYDRSVAGAAATTLFGLDGGFTRNTLVRIGGVNGNPSPNGGIVSTIGPTGLDATGSIHFDISPVTGTAYASIPGTGALRELHVIDLATGAANFVGLIGGGIGIAGLAVPARLPTFVTGAGPGGGPHVRVLDHTGAEITSFFAYASGFAGGVRVALGDVSGDGIPDVITGAGPGGGPHVKVFDGKDLLRGLVTEIRSFLAFDGSFAGGVFVGATDLDHDGRADIVVGAGAGGGPHVRVFSGATGGELTGFFAYPSGFSGGVFVGGAP